MSEQIHDEILDGAMDGMVEGGELPQKGLELVFDEMGFWEKWGKVFEFLKAPSDSGEYRYAKNEVVRIASPVTALAINILLVACLFIFVKFSTEDNSEMEVDIYEPETVEELEDIMDELEPEPIDLPDVTDVIEPPDNAAITDFTDPAPAVDFSPNPAEFDAVALVKSPIIMKGVFGSRNPGMRGAYLKAGGGSGATEGAVLRALRWMKKMQKDNGSWGDKGTLRAPAAITGLCLLCYLAHGETPASKEFGETVEYAIQYLIGALKDNGNFTGTGSHHVYGNGIAAYALAESYGLTKIPTIGDAAEKACTRIVNGQQPGGGFDYDYKKGRRSDTSVISWQLQALKAAKLAGLNISGLDAALVKGVKGLKANYKNGKFGYVKSHNDGDLTSAGVLCMQLLGHAQDQTVVRGLSHMRNWTTDWDNPGLPVPRNSFYHWYYITQAKFHVGGEDWNAWNRKCSPMLVQKQIVEKGVGIEGKDIGHWNNPKISRGYEHGLCYQTAMCTLMLEVYYRYLPTFKQVGAAAQDDANAPPAADNDKEDDIAIDIL